MNNPGGKKRLRIAALTMIAIGVILYLLADRYLIERVEVANAIAPTSAAVSTLAEGSTLNGGETGSASGATTADDWNYQDERIAIAIREISTGSGKNAVTYFVADVQARDATLLAGAFARNEFGRNIIENTSTIAGENQAIFAVNGDYYGFRANGIEIRNGILYRDEPARTGLAFYRDGSMEIYDETETSAQELLDEGVWNTLSFGPALMENSAIAASLDKIEIDTNFGNHSIQGNNPRTGLGIIANNHFVFVAVDGRSSGYSRGGLPDRVRADLQRPGMHGRLQYRRRRLFDNVLHGAGGQ